MEVVEHVADVGLFISKCAEMVKPDGIMFVATINRTLKALGLAIFGDYLYAFELSGTILLLAMVAAVAVTLRHRKDVKGQNPAQQVAVRREDRVRMVKMVSEKERPEAGPGNQPEPTKEG